MEEQIELNKIRSPESKKRVLELQQREIEFQREFLWKSCCGKYLDKRAILFFSQFGISLSVAILCGVQLIVHHDDCSSNSLYSGILSMILGVWLPSPKLNDNKGRHVPHNPSHVA